MITRNKKLTMATKTTHKKIKPTDNYWRDSWVFHKIRGKVKLACGGARGKTGPSISEAGGHSLLSGAVVSLLLHSKDFCSLSQLKISKFSEERI